MSETDPLPLISGSDCSPVPVFSCQIILRHDQSGQQIFGRVANLAGITAKGFTERDVLMQITKIFRMQVQALTEENIPIPWIDPPEKPAADEVERFVPVHL